MKRLALSAAVMALAACSPEKPDAPTGATPSMVPAAEQKTDMGTMSPAPGDTAATKGYKMAMSGAMTSAPAFVGEPDVDFMKQMRGHHKAAIAMARVELANGDDAKAKALAQEIITAQEREIAVIDTWLREEDGKAAAPAG